ncbi:MAG TPA: hypothetical protein VKB76_19935 [Ktedonobacterales bacterium]|nr:hypothetical protein [Ktedonobacterales bacterium]
MSLCLLGTPGPKGDAEPSWLPGSKGDRATPGHADMAGAPGPSKRQANCQARSGAFVAGRVKIGEITSASRVGMRQDSSAPRGGANALPKFDIATTCRDTPDVTAGTGTNDAPATCLSDEKVARDQLGQRWTRYQSADRARCAELSGMKGFQSYVQLLTCLDMAGDAKMQPE